MSLACKLEKNLPWTLRLLQVFAWMVAGFMPMAFGQNEFKVLLNGIKTFHLHKEQQKGEACKLGHGGQEEAITDPYFEGKPLPENLRMRAYWSPQYFTPPTEHNPKAYIYLIHAIKARSLEKISNPQVLKEQALSLSLISMEKNKTWDPCGFILQVPAANIYATSHQDMGLPNQLMKTDSGRKLWIPIFNSTFPITDPISLLKKTGGEGAKTHYNEVFAMGRVNLPHGPSEVEVIGIFEIIDAKGSTLCDDEVRKALMDFQKTYSQVPWVKLPDKKI